MTVSGGEVYPPVTPPADGEGSASKVEVPETVEVDLPTAPDVANVFLGGLLLLASLAACYLR
jgi:hypothetical protein